MLVKYGNKLTVLLRSSKFVNVYLKSQECFHNNVRGYEECCVVL